jgi:hypothetical protein
MVGAWDESSIRSGTIGKSASPYEKTYWRRPNYAETLSRRGEVNVDPVGMKAVGGSDPMRRDTVFRIASMTKPITQVEPSMKKRRRLMQKMHVLTSCVLLASKVWAQTDVEYQSWMKTAVATLASLRKNIEAKQGNAVAVDAQKLETTFKQVEEFWRKGNVEDAVNLSRQAESAAAAISKAGLAGDMEQASGAVKNLAAVCSTCHSAHRERAPGGAFKISMAILPSVPAAAQERVSPHEKTSVTIDGRQITIEYGRPYVKGRKIFGELVPFGEVWRAGADEATVLTTEADLTIGTLKVPKGSYGLFVIPQADGWTLVVNKVAKQWAPSATKNQRTLGAPP